MKGACNEELGQSGGKRWCWWWSCCYGTWLSVRFGVVVYGMLFGVATGRFSDVYHFILTVVEEWWDEDSKECRK